MKHPFKIIIDRETCVGCNVCVKNCPRKVLALKNGKARALKPEMCIGCKLCEMRCKVSAIKILNE